MAASRHLMILSIALSSIVLPGVQTTACEYRFLKSTNSRVSPNVIISPNFPAPYPPNICLIWVYSGTPGSMFVFRIQEMDLPGEVGLCLHSTDSIFIGPLNKVIFCGRSNSSYHPEYSALLTEKNHAVYVIFNSTSSVPKGRGFSADFFLLPKMVESPLLTTTQRPMGHQECDFVMATQSSGSIPGPVATWSTLQRCGGLLTWLVVAPRPKTPFPGATVSFRLSLTSCPSALLHSGDMLEVFDGRNASAPLMIQCSKYASKTLSRVTSGDSFYVRYHIPVPSTIRIMQLRFKRQARCLAGYLNCFNEDACYHPSARCNGSWECPQQGRDEINCDSTPCPPGKYSCEMSNQHCFEEKDRCNGRGTCTNYKDEMDCDLSKCNHEKGLFLCNNGRCIYEKWRCDGTSDCADNSDEVGCGAMMSPRVIVVVVVGSLACCLLLVVALGCVCKMYRLRQLQLAGGPGSRGTCCHNHGRHDSPLTRQLAEMFRQRAPPPPYHEAMLTSRPYREVVGEAGAAAEGSVASDSGRGRHRGVDEGEGPGGSTRPLRRRGSGPHSDGSQPPSSRRHRSRRQHREVHQQDFSSSHPAVSDGSAGFIEVGSLTMLGNVASQADCGEGRQASCSDPPPYSVLDPSTVERLNVVNEGGGLSSGESDQDEEDVVGNLEGLEGMPLRRQRKTRQPRSGRVGVGGVSSPSSSSSFLQVSSVTSRNDHQAQTDTVYSGSPESLLRAEEEREECDKSEDDSCKDEDGRSETVSTSLSETSTNIRLGMELSCHNDNPNENDVVVVEGDSDSDCILEGEENDEDKGKKEDEDIIDGEEEEGEDMDDSDDSDTACLLSAV
ncbi:low-density lipoprotein receptor-related protein 3-like [Plakobranchus ocellatus]|uniref:Low-density lipoprotein receptor-related protein 3-like n=1 Tax=Plakobranchus ocellatus TaxID=259542 RepID=A0AAV3XVM1_9GAST|nr:low-density lipoprotein receptor-related protein 3-like [Plakobranchus ocellatus]